MPTFEPLLEFWQDFDKLTREQKAAFLRAKDEFIEDVDRGVFRGSLRVHALKGKRGIFSMTFEGNDGRATFRYGKEITPGKKHIIWLRVGTHEIY